MTQQRMTPAELQARMAQAIEAYRDGANMAQALQAGFGDRRYLGVDQQELIEREIRGCATAAPEAQPQPERRPR